jgi:YjjG family noncanonical pyrimidine nucleotidase
VTVPRTWVLFDLDGTLLDYAAAERAAVTATLEEVGLVAEQAVLRAYSDINARHWAALERGETTASRLRLERWRELLDAHGLTHVQAEQVATRYIGHLADGAWLLDGALEVVDEVALRHRVGLITNGLADVQRPRIRASGLEGRAEVVVISDEVGVAKPDPGIFEAALEAMGAPPREEVTVVGDSLTADIAGGRAAGLRTVWFADPDAPHPQDRTHQPDHRIGTLQELPPLLRG